MPVHNGVQRKTRFFTWRDALVPVFCLVAVGLDIAYLLSADLGSITRTSIRPATVLRQMAEHIQITALVTVLVLLIAVPLGVLLTRGRLSRLSPLVLGVANMGQAAPTIGLLAIIGIFFVGLWSVVAILTAYSILPVIRNTIVGLQSVDDQVTDAARGMGMSPLGILLRVEIPLAVPVIAAGARTALVLVVATVAFGDYLGAGGLGGLVFSGMKLGRNEVLVLACLLIAVLALLLDWAGGLIQRALTPRALR